MYSNVLAQAARGQMPGWGRSAEDQRQSDIKEDLLKVIVQLTPEADLW